MSTQSTPSTTPEVEYLSDPMDIAPFARVATWDPDRIDGAHASRIEEFRAEDLFTETDLLPDSNGCYAVPSSQDGQGCIGLQWLERRRLKEIGLQLADTAHPPPTEAAQVQAWVGQSAWQGQWEPIAGTIEQRDDKWVLRIDSAKNPTLQTETRKVRWIFPKSSGSPVVRRLWAHTDSLWDTVALTIVLEKKPAAGEKIELETYNGYFADAGTLSTKRTWNSGDTIHVAMQYCKPRPLASDHTVLLIKTPTASFGVAVDDVLSNHFVYVRDAGVLVTTDPAKFGLDQCRRMISRKETVLERVRKLPDQTLAQAMAKTRNPIQDNGPMMISLACDNHKFIVDRDGTIQFVTHPGDVDKNPPGKRDYSGRLIPRFGSDTKKWVARHLDGGWIPVPVITVKEKGISYTQRTRVVPFSKENLPQAPDWLNSKPLCAAEFTIENLNTEPAKASLRLEFLADASKPLNAEVRQVAHGAVVQSEGLLLAWVDFEKADPLKVEFQDGALVLSGALPPGRSANFLVYIPAWDMKPEDYAQLTITEQQLAEIGSYWTRVLAPAMQIEVPDPPLMNLIRASQVHCLIAARNEEQGARIAPWIAAMSYGPLESESNSIIRGMAMMGHKEFARRSLEFFIRRYNRAGFLTTGYTLMGTGWHLWALGEFHDLYKDTAWLKREAPEIDRVCRWITQQREKTKKLDARGEKVPEYGLMPPGVQADWNAFAYYFSLNGYYYAGLKAAAEALADVGNPDAKSLLRNAAEFREDILRAYRWTQSRMPVVPLKNGTWAPGYPSQVHVPGPTNNFFPGEDGNRSWCYDVELGASQIVPQGVLDPNSRDVTLMMDHMEDVQFLAEGMADYPAAKSEQDWFNLGGFAKVQPYYCRNAEIYAMRDDVKPFIRSYFNSIASLLNTETMWFWEHFHNVAAWNKTHETGYFLQQTRFMLVMERGNDLWLAPLVTNNWMKDGMVVAARNAPTRFGPVSYRITSHVAHGFIEATIDPPVRTPPKRIAIRLRHPEGKRIRAVTVNAHKHTEFDPHGERVYIEPNGEKITVKAEF